MKVLILITKSNWGGAQRYVYDIASNLSKEGNEIEVMAGGNGILIERLQRDGIKASGDLPIGRDVNLIEDIKAFFKLLKIIKTKRPDVLHVNSSKIGGLGALAGRIMRVPKVIFTAHGWAFNENRSLFSKILIKLSYWIILSLAHKTIAVSESAKAQVSSWPFISNKITVIHNGIKTGPMFSKINARHELGKINEKFNETTKAIKGVLIIGSVGELHHIKGYEYAIRAIDQMIKHNNAKVIYIILGGGEEKDNLIKLITELKLEKRVILFDYVPNAWEYIKAFDIFLIPSLSEGLPYMALEAGLAGLPIISTAVGGITEIIDDMSSGILIQPKKSTEIRHALEFYISHKKIQKEYGLTIQKKIINEFSIEKMIKATTKVFNP